MESDTRSSSRYKSESDSGSRSGFRKAQFFVLTGFVIISIFYLVSKWLEPYNVIDTSSVIMAEEPFIFNNIKQESLRIIEHADSCNELVKSLEEFKYFVEDYAFRKLIIYFDYSLETPCYEKDPRFPVLVLFDVELRSTNIKIKDSFYGFWPPGSEPSS